MHHTVQTHLAAAVVAPVGQLVLNPFTIKPQITIGTLGLLIAYYILVGPFRRRYDWGPPVPKGQIAVFSLAMVLLLLSLQGPIDDLGESYLFSMHMVQHLLITLIVPPLLLRGMPSWLIEIPLRVPLVFTTARILTRAAIAIVPFNIIFLGWHVPAFYEAALASQVIHAFEHISFMLPATLMWWPIFSPTPLLPALNEGLQVLYLFLTSIPSTLLGAIITFADIVLYPTYEIAPRIVGIAPLSDQRAAGLLMWFGGAAVVLGLMTHRFLRWMGPDAESGTDGVRPAQQR